MFSKETYVRRRSELKKLVGNGLIILFGNNEAPANYPANTIHRCDRIRRSFTFSVSTVTVLWAS